MKLMRFKSKYLTRNISAPGENPSEDERESRVDGNSAVIDGNQNCLHARQVEESQDTQTVNINQSLMCDKTQNITQNQELERATDDQSSSDTAMNQTAQNGAFEQEVDIKTYHLNSVTKKIFFWMFKTDPMYVRFE